MTTRITVVALALITPVYFLLLVFLLPQMTPFSDPLHNWIFHYAVAPAVFSVPWLALLYYRRYRLANTIQLMQESTTAVPLRWRLFYGTNAAFVLMFFILPMVTAPLAILGGLAVAGHVFYGIGVGRLGGGKSAAALAVVVAIVLCIVPTFVLLNFMPMYMQVWESILLNWRTFWFNVVYGVAQSLVNALSFGAPVYFMYYAAGEYDKGVYGESYTKPPTKWIRIGELLLFFIFVALWLPPVPTPFGTIPFFDMSWLFTSYINNISLIIVVVMILVRKGLKVKDTSTMGGTSNIIIVGMFLVVEGLFKGISVLQEYEVPVKTLIIWLAFLIFAIVIIANYLRASPRELY
jgi:hypothetical protein